jgi:hypothetical protein
MSLVGKLTRLLLTRWGFSAPEARLDPRAELFRLFRKLVHSAALPCEVKSVGPPDAYPARGRCPAALWLPAKAANSI